MNTRNSLTASSTNVFKKQKIPLTISRKMRKLSNNLRFKISIITQHTHIKEDFKVSKV